VLHWRHMLKVSLHVIKLKYFLVPSR
jgi:hypothetical protein